jgi:hypothetical protein
MGTSRKPHKTQNAPCASLAAISRISTSVYRRRITNMLPPQTTDSIPPPSSSFATQFFIHAKFLAIFLARAQEDARILALHD